MNKKKESNNIKKNKATSVGWQYFYKALSLLQCIN